MGFQCRQILTGDKEESEDVGEVLKTGRNKNKGKRPVQEDRRRDARTTWHAAARPHGSYLGRIVYSP